MRRPLRPVDKPLPAPWHETHRGGVSVVVSNLSEYAEAVQGWHRVMGLLQRLPYAEREAGIAARRVVLSIGGQPDVTVCFGVVRWEPTTVTLTVRFECVAEAKPCWPFFFL